MANTDMRPGPDFQRKLRHSNVLRRQSSSSVHSVTYGFGIQIRKPSPITPPACLTRHPFSDLGCSLLSNQKHHFTVGHHQATAGRTHAVAAWRRRATHRRVDAAKSVCLPSPPAIRPSTTQILVAFRTKIRRIIEWEIIITGPHLEFSTGNGISQGRTGRPYT